MEGAATKRPQEVWPTLSVVGWLFREGIQRQVQFQNVDPRLSEEAPLSSLSLPRHDGPHRRFAHAARFGDARHLELGGGRRDLGIEARSRSCDHIHGHRLSRILCLGSGHVGVHPIDEFLIGGTQVGSGRSGGIIAIRAGRGRTGVKVSAPTKGCAMMREATTVPLRCTSCPLALSRKKAAPAP